MTTKLKLKTNKSIEIKKEIASNEELQHLLITRAKELNLVVPKCATCTNPCKACKLTFLKKEIQKRNPTSSIYYFKQKRKVAAFWKA